MSDLYHTDFVDKLIEQSEQNPDENDPYWTEFWRLKNSSEGDA